MSNAAERITSRLEAVKTTGPGQWMGRCPAHEDRNPSLSIRQIGNRARVHCFAGCDDVDVLAALGLQVRDLWDEVREVRCHSSKGAFTAQAVASYEYRDAAGRVVSVVHRTADKKFYPDAQLRADGVLLNLPEVIAAVAAGREVWVVEGEEDAHAAALLGLTATTSKGGAQAWRKTDVTALKGAHVVVCGDNDAAGGKYITDVIRSLRGAAASVRQVRPIGKDLSDHVAAGHRLDDLAEVSTSVDAAEGAISDPTPEPGQEARRVRVVAASSIRTERQRWYWADRIPTSTVAVFAGRGGEGKSSFAFHLAAETSRGALPGDYHRTPSPVLIWSGEDRWETVVVPRLTAAGADLDRVFQLAIDSTVDADTLEVSPNLPDDLPLVREAIEQTGARLVIIDPISSTMRGDLNKEADTRRTLDGLARIAHHTGAAILAIRHFNKGQGNASDKVSGSHAFRDAARAVFLFATDDESGHRIVTQDKGNYSQHGAGSFAFDLESVQIPIDDGESAEVARVVILGESDVSVSDIINRTTPSDDGREDRNAATAFILDHLRSCEAEEAKAADVLKLGRAAGFSETDLKNARARSRTPKIVSRKAAFGAGWVWAIDHGKLSAAEAEAFDGIARGLEEITQGVEGVQFSEHDTLDAFVTPSPPEIEGPGYCSGCGMPTDRCKGRPECEAAA